MEEQLLGRVIQKEQRSLEESLKNVLEEVELDHNRPNLKFLLVLFYRSHYNLFSCIGE